MMKQTVLAVTGLITILACVKRYDTEALTPTDTEINATIKFTYPLEGRPDKVNLVNAEWPKIGAQCAKARAAMQRESDGITTRNSVVGATFAGATAALAIASGLYTTSKGEDADPTISSALALGAGGTAVPTFFYFGSDEREKVVNARIQAIDDALSRVNESWVQFNGVQIGVTQAQEAADTATDDYHAKLGCGGLADDAAAARCVNSKQCDGIADLALRGACNDVRARQAATAITLREQTAAWHGATNTLDQSVQKLALICR
jgi:hypothetical protein